MPEYPDDIFSPRETENLPGIVFNPADKKNLYSEDYQALGGEINAIETTLGENPQGAYATVKEWLQYLADHMGGSAVWGAITGTLSDQEDLQDALDAKQNSIGYTPENVANKKTSMANSGTDYPSTSAVTAALADKQDVLTSANAGAFVTGLTAKTTPVDADQIPLVDSAASNVLKKLTWGNVKATLKTYFDTLYLAATASAQLIPTGGSTGDVLTKDSGTDFDVSFQPQSGGGGVTGGGNYISSDQSTTSNSAQDITGFSVSLLAGKSYLIEGELLLTVPGSDSKIYFTGPASPSSFEAELYVLSNYAVNDGGGGYIYDPNPAFLTSYGAFSNTGVLGFPSGSSRNLIPFHGKIVNGSNAGAFKMQFSSNSGGTSTVKRGSWWKITQLD